MKVDPQKTSAEGKGFRCSSVPNFSTCLHCNELMELLASSFMGIEWVIDFFFLDFALLSRNDCNSQILSNYF